MKKGKPLPAVQSILIHRMYENIPHEDLKAIRASKESAFNRTQDHVRLQVSIPWEAFAVLRYYGAFDATGESGFFAEQAVNHINGRLAITYKLVPQFSVPTGVH